MAKVKDAGPFERILTVVIDEESITKAKPAAARRLAQDVKIKGFRPGKAPMKILRQRFGTLVQTVQGIHLVTNGVRVLALTQIIARLAHRPNRFFQRLGSFVRPDATRQLLQLPAQ